MRIAIASGKGGTGKTTLATNLAFVASETGARTELLDCDVEEPNCHLFLHAEDYTERPVEVLVPRVDESKCTMCGECGRLCRFSAIVAIGERVHVFDEMCHSCGGCAAICPTGAIEEVPRAIGVVRQGSAEGVRLAYGLLNVGEPMSPPVIAAVKGCGGAAALTIIDAPPGTSCPAIEAMREADYVVMVTEPTPFGLNDLELAVGAVRELGMPFGVVINRAGSGDEGVDRYCREEGIAVLGRIPEDRAVAEAYSRGLLVAEAVPGYAGVMRELLEYLASRAWEAIA